MLNEILDKEMYQNLVNLAYKQSKAFCYSCYQEVDGQFCNQCHSDDNMRLLDGVGVDYGIEWVIEHIISANCGPVDEDYIKESLASCYEETVKIGWIEYDMMTAIEILDPISYRIAIDEYRDGLVQDQELIEVNGNHYWRHDIESFIEKSKMKVA